MMTLLLPTILAAAFHFFLSVNMALVTPFAQHLGVPFHSVSYIWVLGPILGFAAQMFIGATSDSFRSRFGRRRPFVLLGAVGTLLSALLMAFGVDLGSLLGDNARETNGSRPMGAVFFIMGLCLADFAIHTTMGPFRALISEISGEGNKEMAYSLKVFWGAVGQILGYCASAYGTWEKVLPFLRTMSCGPTCANVKGPLLVAAVLLILCTAVVMVTGKEISTHMETRDENLVSPLLLPEAADIENGIITDTILFDAVLPAGIRANASSTASAWSAIIQGVQALFTPTPGSTQGVSDILLVVVLSWMAWFPFVLFNTDWMGRDIFGGSPHGTELSRTQYHMGVHEGAVGLVLHAIFWRLQKADM